MSTHVRSYILTAFAHVMSDVWIQMISVCLGELSKCYRYFDIEDRGTWNEANHFCQSMGFTLPTFHRQTDIDFLGKWSKGAFEHHKDLRVSHTQGTVYMYIGNYYVSIVTVMRTIN